MEFDDIVSGKEAFLNQAILLETQEGLRLDFKAPAVGKPGAAFTPQGQLTKDGRSSLAKALSAFSNSAGGVLVIGVECRKNADGVDCACDLEPLPNWRTALSAVSSAVGDLLQPKNDGIRIDGFASDGNQSLGYIVVDVPRSERRPHRSEAADLKQYFKRSGSGSYAMEHFDIEDAFRRTAVPELKLRTDDRKFRSSGSNGYYNIQLWLDNVSSVTAFFPSITTWDCTGIQFGWGDDRLPSVRRINEADKVTAYGDSEFVIHPDSTRQIEEFEFHAAFENGSPVIVGDRLPNMAHLSFKYRIGAQDMISREESIEIRLFPFKW